MFGRTPPPAATFENSPYMTLRICSGIARKPIPTKIALISSLPLSLPVALVIDTIVFIVGNILGGILSSLATFGIIENFLDHATSSPTFLNKLANLAKRGVDRITLRVLTSTTVLTIAATVLSVVGTYFAHDYFGNV